MYVMTFETNFKVATILSLLMLSLPGLAFSDLYLTDSVSAAAANIPEVVDERDPGDEGDCFVLGELDIAFHTNNDGPPTIGVLLTDPRGRRIGFDPLTKHAWQELPEAEGFVDCDASGGKLTCGGIVRVCGPLSGTYKLEAIAQETYRYTIRISARSEETGHGPNLQSSSSSDVLRNISVRKGYREVISLHYSRDSAVKVAAQLQRFHNGRYETRSHSTGCKSGKKDMQTVR
jgi:hypothetical protein